MATEKRLIDANELKKKAEMRGHCIRPMVTNYHQCVTVRDIDNAPTVDAVEVIRCKDCKFYKDSPMGGKGCHTHFNGRTEFIPKNDNDFCSYGRKKIDEQKDC